MGQMVTELAKLGAGPGKIDVEEYFSLRLFDDTALDRKDKRAFMGMRACKDVGLAANQHSHWLACVSDKLVFNTLLHGLGLPVFANRGYYHHRFRLPGLGRIGNATDIHRFLAECTDYPFFGKPTGAARSTWRLRAPLPATRPAPTRSCWVMAAASLLAIWPRRLPPTTTPATSSRSLAARIPTSGPCPAMSVATVRVYTLYGDKGPRIYKACWKLPVGRNVADNFWRGNILAALDLETGTITRAVQGVGLGQVELQNHPRPRCTPRRHQGSRLGGAEENRTTRRGDLRHHAASRLRHCALRYQPVLSTNDGPTYACVQDAGVQALRRAWPASPGRAIGTSSPARMAPSARSSRRASRMRRSGCGPEAAVQPSCAGGSALERRLAIVAESQTRAHFHLSVHSDVAQRHEANE